MIPNNLITIASFTPNSLQSPNAWAGHLPFAAWVIQEVVPKIFVELGTHSGNSYFSFCQSVVEAGLTTKCSAIDTWQGDEHAGQYDEEIFAKVNAYNQEHYAGFSQLLRMTFDDAVSCFADESIDLLHIDGLHTYEAVRHDFDNWLPKLAPGAVVIFHDTNVHERNFGVWKFWKELQVRYPSNLEFVHSYGLGVLQLNNAPDNKKLEWLQPIAIEKQKLINYFSALGSRQLERFELNELKQHVAAFTQALAERDVQIAAFAQAMADRDKQIASFTQAMTDRDKQIASFTHALAERDKQITGYTQAFAERDRQITGYTQALAERDRQITGYTQALAERDRQITSYTQALAERDKQIASYTQALAELDVKIASLTQVLTERDGQIAGYTQALADRERQINDFQNILIERDEQIDRLTKNLAERDIFIDNYIKALADRDRQIKDIYSSKSWRLTKPLRLLQSEFMIRPLRFMCRFLLSIARIIWRRIPLSPLSKDKIYRALLKWLSAIDNWAIVYNDSPNSGLSSSSDRAVSSNVQIQNTDTGSGCVPQSVSELPKEIYHGDFGINILGSITSESGVGEAVRGEIRAIETTGINFVLNNITSNSRENDRTYENFADQNPYSVNLIHLNADSIPSFLAIKGKEYFHKKYNIGFWVWELPEFPQVWHTHFKYFDEIWTASNFCVDALSKVSPVPVMKVPHSIQIKLMSKKQRSDFGLSEDSFIFFFMFDFLSIFDRKNPLAVINAFKLAFKQNEDAFLILKYSNSNADPKAKDAILKAAKGTKIKIIDQYLDKDYLYGLLNLSDCYVSLHRSEGFGLTMAQAMYLKKPVIATSYSGNTDFMNINNSFPVKYKLIEIEKDIGPYTRGNVWADPDCEHAAEMMRLVYEDRNLARKIGEVGAKYIQTELSPQRVGRRISQRLETIMKVQNFTKR